MLSLRKRMLQGGLIAALAALTLTFSTAVMPPLLVKAAAVGLEFAQGNQSATPADDPVVLFNQTMTVQNFTSANTGVIDVRTYSSYSLRLNVSGGTYLNTDVLTLDIEFYNNVAAAAADLVFLDSFKVYKSQTGGFGPIRLTDVMHGGWMRIFADDTNSVGRSVNLDTKLTGSFRPNANTFLRTSQDFVLHTGNDNLNAGVSTANPAMKLAYGRAMMSMKTGAAGGATMTVQFGFGGAGTPIMEYILVGAAANTRYNMEIVMPRHQGRVTITNTAGANQTITSWIVEQVEPF